MATRDSDFHKNHGKPGWIYVARNEFMREDLYKVGCTTKEAPEIRVTQLNTEQRGGTSRLGFFNLVFAAAVLDAQGCEAALLRRLEILKESKGKEFVNAPLDLVIGEVLHIQKLDLRAAVAVAPCPACGGNNRFPPHPFVRYGCGHCNTPFLFVAPGVTRHATLQDRHTLTYSVIDKVNLSAHSPLAKAFMQMRDTTRSYFDGELDLEEAYERLKHWIDWDPPLDRSPMLYQKPPTAPRKPKTKSLHIKTRKGWLECPSCLSSVKPDMDGLAICLECGWSNEANT
ncbi:GIY-YIG nuclease family protein [Comamonas thiooxydans]|uniref:GIY-YIG nuclease family protein n=1 Tax=Comamonas thiooxydans TaxID=363952 RepID=UPI000B4144B0|nr:GIY-YIG nuclease family protein [Comamonas thiooxydans]